jgi:hypothetical protein
MKKSLTFAFVFALTLTLGCGSAFALTGNGSLSGKHWQFNIIGSPNGISGDNSNGHTIMVPLGEKKVNKNSSFGCTLDGQDQFEYVEDEPGLNYANDPNAVLDTYIVKGVKLIFEPSEDGEFAILDRDATDDGVARILVPDTTGQDGYDGVDVFIRILGKPYACMAIDGVAYDADQASNGMWYYSGHVTLNRKSGKSVFQNINDLFDVYYCDTWDDSSGEWVCTDTNIEEISVFSNVFEEYFWDIQNSGSRIVQVRLYPRKYQK